MLKAQGQKVLKLESVSKNYFTESVRTEALTSINFEVFPGDFIVISGPSGSGKSSLLSILGLLDDDYEGAYYLNGALVKGLSFRSRANLLNKKIGFVFQSYNLIGDMNVFDNIALPLKYSKSYSKSEIHDLVMQALSKLGLESRSKHRPSQLSGGQQQRVAIARAVINKPDVILADEPTGNLDSASSEQVVNLLKNLNAEGVSICMVTHEESYRKLGNKLYEMNDGSLKCSWIRE